MIKWIALALVLIPAQGYMIFLLRGGGLFLSQKGLECTMIPAFIEFALLVTSAMAYERIHASAASNPHSVIGSTLRKDAGQPPAAPPPPTRAAWDGGWEDPNQVSEKMKRGH